jgi:putative nucleotidyltransferase with HDIG domain
MNPDITSAQKVDPPDARPGFAFGYAEVRRVELAVGQCETLSILPSSAARFFAGLGRMELTPSSLSELIEADPALTVLVLRLCRDKKIVISQPDYWILQALEGLSLREIRDAMLSVKIYGGLSDDPRTDFRKELTRHSLAVACCAEQLAQFVTPALESHTAYLTGLLHDTGKFLLDEAMPKSFDILLEQARTGKTSLCRVEQANLGLDHAILGKRLAQKLRLPSDVILGIWLHHSQTGAVAQTMPQARIAAVVELADSIVRRAGIGESGAYDEEVSAETIAGSLGLITEQIERVTQRLPELVQQKSEAAGLSILKPGWAYCDSLRAMASQLAGESTKLFEESARLQSNASNFDFVREMLAKLNSNMTAVELAGEFAVTWQRFYQTGPVCVYLVGAAESKAGSASSPQVVEAAVVESKDKAKAVILDIPPDVKLVPQPVREKFAVIDAGDYADWLFEQLDVEFDRTRTKMAPLVSDGGFDTSTKLSAGKLTTGKTVGIIVFELRHPTEGDISERFAPAARLGGVILDMLEAIGSQQWYAERFAQLLTAGGQKTEDIGQKANAEALAEMAAGAAHELNNPLSVISGRAQLLAASESDPDKKRILEQIQANGRELSSIIDDLMSYANPPAPRPTETAVRQIIDEAIDLAGRKLSLSRLNIKIDISPDTPNVFVDSAQIDIAVSNIICNAFESYDGPGFAEGLRRGEQAGAIEIKVSPKGAGQAVTIQVIDSGRGMDVQTLAKATQPFFSNKPAGRKRGMGLAHAQRLIEINNGTLELSSQQGKGTAVKVTLPSKFLDADLPREIAKRHLTG